MAVESATPGSCGTPRPRLPRQVATGGASNPMAVARRSRRLAAARDGGEAAEAERQRALQQATEAAKRDPAWRDWAGGLPEEVLEAVAGAVVAQTEAAWAGHLGAWGRHSERIEKKLAERKRDGNCLFVFARVCKNWRKAQLKVGGPLHALSGRAQGTGGGETVFFAGVWGPRSR